MAETETSKAWDLEIPPGSTQVKMAFFLGGQGGSNHGRFYIDDTDPDSVPDLHIVIADADGKHLLTLFTPRPIPEPEEDWMGRPTASSEKDPDANLRKWIASERLKIIHLALKDTAGQKKKAFGAGGDPEVGRKMIRDCEDQIKAALGGMELIVSSGVAGGGVGTATLEEGARIAKELNTPHFSIMIAPKMGQGKKIATAEGVRKKLREPGPLQVIRSEDLPKEKRVGSPEEIYRAIYVECRGVLEVLAEVTQVVGRWNNIDWNDMLAGMKDCKDYATSNHVLSEADRSEINTDRVVRGLLDFPLQDKKIRAKALFFLYRGSWPDSTTDDIEKGVQTGTGFPSSGLTKKQNNESAAEMSVFVIAFGTFESNEAVGEHVDSIEIASATRATKADTTAAPSREKIL